MVPAASSGYTLFPQAGAKCDPPEVWEDDILDWHADSSYYAFASFSGSEVGALVEVHGARSGGTPGEDSESWAESPTGGYAQTQQNGQYTTHKTDSVWGWADASFGGPLSNPDSQRDDASVDCNDDQVEAPDVPDNLDRRKLDRLVCQMVDQDDSSSPRFVMVFQFQYCSGDDDDGGGQQTNPTATKLEILPQLHY
jgi:hypothetical protein